MATTRQSSFSEFNSGVESRSTCRDIIFTGIGSEDAVKAAYRGGALIGFEASRSRPPEEFPIEFVDYPFKRIERGEYEPEEVIDEYIETVKTERPTYAVIPDIDGNIDPDRAFEVGYELEPYVDTLIIAPKELHPSTVPDDIRVGIPCQEKFAADQWDVADYADCDELHLFGGSPHDHYEIIYEKGLTNVESMDTSVPLSSARWGDSWGLTLDGNPKWFETKGGFYGCLEYSFKSMNQYLNEDRDEVRGRRLWVERPDWGKRETCGTPDDDLLHPHDDKPFPGREYYEELAYTRHK